MKGFIHSYETCGAVDGPGIRFVVFTQGCPLRCKFCHNPDTWDPKAGTETDSSDLVDKISRYETFMRSTGGGLTVSGGEPLMQPDFVSDLFRRAKKRGIHTALDTSGAASEEALRQVLEYTDLMLLDVKSTDLETYTDITGVKTDFFSRALEVSSAFDVEIWLRLVVVPGFTDRMEEIEKILALQNQYPNIKKIELLPFHKMGEYKWKELGIAYTLEDTPEPDKALMDALNGALEK